MQAEFWGGGVGIRRHERVSYRRHLGVCLGSSIANIGPWNVDMRVRDVAVVHLRILSTLIVSIGWRDLMGLRRLLERRRHAHRVIDWGLTHSGISSGAA
jgi:hypothetical protein